MLPLLSCALLVVNAVCFGLGAVAAVLGGSLERVGSGPGGLWGWPTLVMLGMALVGAGAGAVGVVSARGRRDLRARALVLAFGPALVFAVAFQGAHVVDPCSTGLLDLRDKVDGTRACWPAEGALSLHERFHLLGHGAVGLAAALALVAAERRTRPAAADADARPEPVAVG